MFTLVWFGLVLMVRQDQPGIGEESRPAIDHKLMQSTAPYACEGIRGQTQRVHVCVLIDSMILPQVHLRKPCYDFSFL